MLFIDDGPYVYLIAQTRIDHRQVELALGRFEIDNWHGPHVSGEPEGSSLAEIAGRVCYWSFGKGRKSHREYIENLLSKKHGSVIEHTSYTFFVAGISRACSHELVRHRAGWAYSQLSTRYVGPELVRFVIPYGIRHDPELVMEFKEECLEALETYKRIHYKLEQEFAEKNIPKTLRRKLVNQAARYVLPNATETRLVATANARALRHFVEMRGSRHADIEIRKLANAIFSIMKYKEPILFADYVTTDLGDGTFEITTDWNKV